MHYPDSELIGKSRMTDRQTSYAFVVLTKDTGVIVAVIYIFSQNEPFYVCSSVHTTMQMKLKRKKLSGIDISFKIFSSVCSFADVGSSGGAMVPGRPTIWIRVGQGPTALAVGAGGGCLDIFTLVYPFSPLSPSIWETARYRLKYCLKGPLNPKQPTNQPLLTL